MNRRIEYSKGNSFQKGGFARHEDLLATFQDASYALAAANEYGVPMPTLAAARELYQMAKGLGFGEQDFAAVAEGLRQVSDQTERT